MRSIGTKLILAFLSIGIISVTAIFITARWNTRQEFIRFLTDQDRTNIIAQLTNYYEINKTWGGAEVYLYSGDGRSVPGNRPPRRIPFILTDPKGSVLIANERYSVGDKLSASDLRQGVPLTEAGRVVGVLVPMPMPFQGQRSERLLSTRRVVNPFRKRVTPIRISTRGTGSIGRNALNERRLWRIVRDH